jgi:hypothetical protein
VHEIYERLSIRKHGSFLPHGAIFKISADILEVGDVWAADTSKIELNNAVVKQTATQGGARNLTIATQRTTIAPQRSCVPGPAALVVTKGYSTSMALSTLRKLIGNQYLNRGDGIYANPMSRRRERLFGQWGTGRTKCESRLGSCEAKMGTCDGFDPREDTCLKAFVRLLAARAKPV